MKMTLCIPILGSLGDTKPVYASWIATIGCEADLLIIDNNPNSNENQVQFFANYVRPQWKGNIDYAPQETNLGVVKSLQFAYEYCKDSDILAFIHNDVYIYTQNWGQMVLDWFLEHQDTGLLGFFGAEGVHPSSGRFSVWNNMLEAEIHGWRFTEGHKQVAVLDGLSMIASGKMLEVRHGVDTSFDIHHFYDLDLSLESLDRGFNNYVLPIYIHHQSGITACRPMFQRWADDYVGEERGEQVLYHKNLQRFREKWSHRLPYQVGRGWGK